MSSGLNIIVPAVPLAKREGRTPLKTSGSTGSVNHNPPALTFAPEQFKQAEELSVNAPDFVPQSATRSSFHAVIKATADKYDALNFAQRSILNPNASSFTPRASLEPKPSTRAPVYNRPLSPYTPNLHDPASLPIEPYDPFNKQLFEIDMNRHGWVPSVYDYDTQYDSNRIYDPNDNIVRMAPPVSLEGPPADYMYCGRIPRSVDMPVDILVYHAPAPSYSTNPNPPPAFPGYSSLASYDTPVYATAPQFVQKHQDSGKKGKKAGYMDGGKPRSDHGFDTNYDAGFVSRQPFANHDYDTYGFATPHNGNGYNSAPGGEFSTYAPAYGVSTGNVHSHMNDNRYGNGNGSAGPDNRGRGQKGQRYKQKFNKKNQQNEYAGDLHQNEYSKPPRNNDYPVRHFNDYPSDGPLNSNYFMPPSFQNTLQLPRQNDEHRDEHRNSNNSFGNPAQSSQHKLRADRRHEFHNTSDSSASMEFSSSPVTELHKPACEDSDLPLRNTHCKPKDAFGKFEPEEMTDKTTGGGADVAKVDALVKITYADIAKGKGISMGASAIAKKNPADKNAAASGDVSSGETQMHMDNAVSVKGEEEGEGKFAASEASDITFSDPMGSW